MWRSIFLGPKQYTVKRADIWHVCGVVPETEAPMYYSLIILFLWLCDVCSDKVLGKGHCCPSWRVTLTIGPDVRLLALELGFHHLLEGCINFLTDICRSFHPYLLQGFWLPSHPKPLLQQWSMHGIQMASEESKSILLESFPCSVSWASFSALFLSLNGHKMPGDHFDNGVCPTQKKMSEKHLANGTHKPMYNSSFFSSFMYRHPEIQLL